MVEMQSSLQDLKDVISEVLISRTEPLDGVAEQKTSQERPAEQFWIGDEDKEEGVQPEVFNTTVDAVVENQAETIEIVKPTVAAWTRKDCSKKTKREMGICIEDKGDMHVLPAPIANFEELNQLFPPYAPWTQVLEDLQGNGIEKPLPIQSQALPLVLSGQDVIGIAQTGSGKTLAYLLPAMVHILAQVPICRGSPTPIALIMAPTRELAVQIVEEVHKARGWMGGWGWGGDGVGMGWDG
eukprot:s2187_g7.t1